jgi:uncharacterized membrane protein YfcA
MFSFIFAASWGIFLGAYLVKFVQASHLQKAFAYFLLFMSGFIFWQNRNAFYAAQASSEKIVEVSSQFSDTKTRFLKDGSRIVSNDRGWLEESESS